MIGAKVIGLGEIVIRVQDIALLTDFYQHIIGLELLHQRGKYTFFKIAEGYAGHDQILALFDVSIPTAFDETKAAIQVNHTSLHHIALEIDKVDYAPILRRLQQAGVETKTEVFEWVQWKSIFIRDPEMNIIEFVCFDHTIPKN